MSKLAKALTAAAGNAGGGTLGYVEDVFSTYLYEGNGTSQSIDNGIDLDGEGGMVWIRSRDISGNGTIFDTERANGFEESLYTDTTSAVVPGWGGSVDSTGFNLAVGYTNVNGSGNDYASWTFRKAEKFFDVVTYTGNGNSGYRQISHNLGSTPAAVILKNTTAAASWYVYHKDTAQPGDTDYATHGAYLNLNSTAAKNFSNSAFPKVGTSSGGVTAVYDSSVFTIGEDLNELNRVYVLYLFASDAGGFGDDGDESIIKCGEFSVDGSYEADVECGFEPQWVLIKPAEDSASWNIFDTMRGAPVGGDAAWLAPNLSQAEAFTANRFNPTATGFHIGNYGITAGNKIIYIAIRRPMKTPESGTEVFQSLAYTGNGASTRDFDLDLTLDAYFQACRSSSTYDFKNLTARLTGKGLYTAGTGAEVVTGTSLDAQDGLRATVFENTLNQSGETYIINGFKRATGFFDVVAYTGNTTSGRIVNHNLKVAPELIITKTRSGGLVRGWAVYHKDVYSDGDKSLFLNTSAAAIYDGVYYPSTPNSTSYTLGTDAHVNNSSNIYIAYLFATLDGVSKVGSYTGNGTTQNIDCGFSGGARFVLIKRTDDSESWHVFDTERGIVSGDDPALRLDSTVAEFSSAAINPYSAGFQVEQSASCNNNVNGGSYIFLAIA